MKFYSIDPNVDVVETPVEEQGRIIRHLHLAKGNKFLNIAQMLLLQLSV